MQPRTGVAPAAAAPIANDPGRVGAVMDDQGGSNGMMISSEEAAELIPLEQYVSLGYTGLGMIGAIRPELESRDVAEWRPSSSEMETGGPTFVTMEIDVLEVTRALDHRIPLPIGHLLFISEQANERMMRHCKANRKRFALARAKDQKAKAPTSEEKADVAADAIRVGLIQKDDHFLRIKPILWKSAECDIEVWGVPYSAIIDSGAAVLAISLRVVERAGRKNDLIMLTEKDQLVSADEEKIKTVGRMTNVVFRLGKVHALGDVVVLDVNTYDVLFGLPALVALRAYLDFERRSVILRNTGGKPYVIPMRLTLQTSVKVVPRMSPETMGALRMVSWSAPVDGGQSSNGAGSDDDDDPVVTRPAAGLSKSRVVKEAPVPTSLTQVRAFLGLASYYRRFIKGFAAIARPLTNLLRKEQPLHWDDECDQAFGALKDALVTTPILIRPDPSRQFIFITDWQPEAILAILAQKGNDGKEHVIEYASRTVPDERRNDSAPQGECYAVVWSIQHFHPYLYGQKFLLVTNHEPLLALKKLTNYTGMIGRWAVRLQEYEFDIYHRKTERHGNADELTRLHRPGCRRLLTQELTVPIAQLADDLDVSIVSQVDPRLVPHVTSRTLSPYLQWSACVEGFPFRIPPSRLDYLDPRDIVDPAFYRPPYEDELEEIIREELAEESSEEEEENPNEDEEGPAQQREGEEDELLQTENEEEEEEEDSEQGSGDDNDEEHADEDPQLEIAPVADLPISNDPTLDPEPPQPDDGDVAQMAGPSACRGPEVVVASLAVLAACFHVNKWDFLLQ
ncbi:hypothetical protein CBR_g52022 [Chara braunii]|uniref:Reverse transcriptase/retrotransposon-derived protein RNase H-like domain-containing protein n=1 Tax=Chara braunii TaxID=69332 RepID=A0A388M9A4_CHABU|nr:hypothetical protein CBR_g52022 [Chara braunii]|eukprot:GBG91141.1 hypothetical protein CBR_g52022 [Chara braunii]